MELVPSLQTFELLTHSVTIAVSTLVPCLQRTMWLCNCQFQGTATSSQTAACNITYSDILKCLVCSDKTNGRQPEAAATTMYKLNCN